MTELARSAGPNHASQEFVSLSQAAELEPLRTPPGTMTQNDPLVVQVVSSFDQCPVSPQAWDEAVARLGGPIYMTFDWLKTWWEFYGQDKDLRLFIFRVDGEIVGLLPIYLDSLGIRPLNLNVGRIVGANIPPKPFNPPVHASWAGECFEFMLRRLLIQDRCDLISLGPVASNRSPWEEFPMVCRRLESLASLQIGEGEVQTMFELPGEFDELFRALPKNQRKNRISELRAIRRDFVIRKEVIGGNHDELLMAFDRFADQHTRQWNAAGRPGHFRAWPNALAYNRSLVSAQSRRNRVRFIQLVADETVIASHYVYSFGDCWFCELGSREIASAWNRYGLGQVGNLLMFEAAMNERIRLISDGLGHYAYKAKLGAKEYPTRIFRVLGRRSLSRMRARMYDTFRFLLKTGYHRLWYRRMMPHLPSSFRQGKWQLWLRFDY